MTISFTVAFQHSSDGVSDEVSSDDVMRKMTYVLAVVQVFRVGSVHFGFFSPKTETETENKLEQEPSNDRYIRVWSGFGFSVFLG